jgi:uncharacterized tellurite resistance protein B-like protein
MTQRVQLPPPEAIERIRFESELKLFEDLSSDRLIAPVAERLRKSNVEHVNRRRLLANALRITDRIIPALKERIDLAKRITHLENTEVETFVYSDPRQCASCMCFENGNIFLLISSSLYSMLTERELLFVIGHEFGHVVYEHYMLPARAILAQKGACDAENAVKLMAWSRRAEISADRVGLLCCQDLDAAAKAFLKLSSGLNEELIEFDLQGYVSQVLDLEAVSRSVRAVDDLYSTHPFNPIRIVALYRFWQSDIVCELFGHAPGKQWDQDADSRICELLQLMDPDAATMGTRNVDECVVWGGFWVASSDGQIDQLEVEAISKSVKSQIAREALAFLQGAAEPNKIIREKFDRAALGCRHLPPPQRHAIIQRLVAVAKASMDIADKERTALQQICGALELDPSFAEKILAQYALQVQYTDAVFAQPF